MARMTRMPPRPRLMRPLRSVMHSPRLTNRNGVLTRMAPPSTATGTPHQPSDVTPGDPRPERRHAPVQPRACGWRAQLAPALRKPAARPRPADQSPDGHDGDRVRERDECHEDAAVAV